MSEPENDEGALAGAPSATDPNSQDKDSAPKAWSNSEETALAILVEYLRRPAPIAGVHMVIDSEEDTVLSAAHDQEVMNLAFDLVTEVIDFHANPDGWDSDAAEVRVEAWIRPLVQRRDQVLGITIHQRETIDRLERENAELRVLLEAASQPEPVQALEPGDEIEGAYFNIPEQSKLAADRVTRPAGSHGADWVRDIAEKVTADVAMADKIIREELRRLLFAEFQSLLGEASRSGSSHYMDLFSAATRQRKFGVIVNGQMLQARRERDQAIALMKKYKARLQEKNDAE